MNNMDSRKREKLGELIRFGIVGVIATLIQYAVYLGAIPLLAHILADTANHTVATLANTVAYIVSVLFNFYASTRYTFRVKANAKKGAGFAFSHVINYSLQTVCLNFFVVTGISKQTALIPTLCICIPINFMLVRFFLKK